MNKTPLYKYRGLSSLGYFIDIILNKRLFAAKYSDLNDPFEAFILGSNLNGNIYEQRSNARICSASESKYNELMWSHYADGHRGCCIEFVPTSSKWDVVRVEYGDKLVEVTNETPINDILKHKLKPWEYEKEIRFIKQLNPKRPNSNYLKVKITKVYLGVKMNKAQKKFFTKLIKQIDDSIEIIEVKKEDFLKNRS